MDIKLKTLLRNFFFLILLISIFSNFVLAGESDSARTADIVQSHDQIIHSEKAAPSLGEQLTLWSIIPFIGILLSIALFPLLAPHFWHHHFPKVSAGWALIFAIPFLYAFGGQALHDILHIYLIDYIPFIILLWGLFTISGGILLKGTIKGTPPVNLLLLLIGTLLASWIGTTGAAMVLIRPMLRANAQRKSKAHLVVFFIFLVANVGGSLTPLGDPPLFLGFLHGVSFFWTLNLLPEMLTVSVILLIMFFGLDSFYYRKERLTEMSVSAEREPIGIEGVFNFLFLFGIVAGVIFSGVVNLGHFSLFGVQMSPQNVIRDIWIIFMGLLSLRLTKKETREGNGFSWAPILEVAYLFAGIFMTIIPALAILQAGEKGSLGSLIHAVKEPWHYFWATGILSSFLDNAPTYLTFFNSALGKLGLTEAEVRAAFAAGDITTRYPEFIGFLKTISCGAVFMGANTYIGNAPNFMVKSIAEENGVNMPSFFGYMIKYSIPILIPAFIIVTLIFF